MKLLTALSIGVLIFNVYSVSDNIIPIDAENANIMLKAGILDSLEWQKIESFYSMPISVPSGELIFLRNLFPEIDYDLPVTDEELSKYEPWNKNKIDTFFKDFPELVKYKPILNFNFSESPYKGQLTFLNKSENCSLTYSRVNVFMEPVRNTRLTARAEINNYNARWQNRLIQTKPFPTIEIQIGNIDGLPDRGLILGNFPGEKQCKDSSVLSNWIYGKNRTWNGMKISYQTSKSQKENNWKLISLIHKQPEELIAGFYSEIDIHKEITLTITVSELISDILNEKQTCISGGLKINRRLIKTEIYAGIDSDDPKSIPVYFNSILGGKDREVLCKLIYLPEKAEFNYSRVAHNLRSRSEADSDAANLAKITIQTKSNNSRKFMLIPEIEFNLKNWDIYRIDGAIRFSGVTKEVRWSTEISTILLEDSVESAKLNTDFDYYPCKMLSLKWSSNLGLSRNEISFLYNKNFIDFLISPALNVGLLIELLTHRDFSDYLIQPGLISVIHLPKKSESHFQINWPIKNKKVKGFKLECKAIFTF